jgi:membrane protease YdiL (CAAX protease family)
LKKDTRFAARTAPLLPGLAILLFGPLLAFRRLGPLDFWWGLSASLGILVMLSIFFDTPYRSLLRQDLRSGLIRKIALGLASALVLYLIFWTGGVIFRLLLPFSVKEIGAVYAFKQDASTWRIVLLIFLVIGPGEELFWRGFVQRRWERYLGFPWGWLSAAAFYSLVHIGSRNLILLLAALVCGLYWGGLYSWSRSILLVSVSHIAWDMAVFIVIPLL